MPWMTLDWSRQVMAPLQRKENGLQSTMSTLLGGSVSELGEQAKLPTCFGGLGIRVAQLGCASQATCWSAVDRHAALMPRICDEPLLGAPSLSPSPPP